jgi:hypothetical protein
MSDAISDNPAARPDTAAALAALTLRVARLEAENAVRRTLARYMALCDVPCTAGEPDALRTLFATDAVWEGIGRLYTKKFGQLVGIDAIVAMLSRYLPPTPHFAINAHLLGSESIEVAADACSARGQWMMQQTSIYVHKDGVPAECVIARLDIDFVLGTDGQWRIAHFRTERLLDAPMMPGMYVGQSYAVSSGPAGAASPRT